MAAPMGGMGLLLRVWKKTSLSRSLILRLQYRASSYVNTKNHHLALIGGVRRLCSKDGSEPKETMSPVKTTSKLDLAKPKGRKKQIMQSSASPDSDSSSSSDSSDSSDDETQLGAELVSAAKGVAKTLGGDIKQTESDLLQQLRSHHALTERQKQGDIPKPRESLKSTFSGLKVEKKQRRGRRNMQFGRDEEGSGKYPSSEVDDRRSVISQMNGNKFQRARKRQDTTQDMRLYEGPDLGIFASDAASKAEVEKIRPPSLFDRLEQEELIRSTLMPPANAYEEMIQMTKEGKLRHFPVDNEQGMTEEAQVGFQDHVFLEHLIEDFPKKGPIRHFMELVMAGLSNNPYLTVEQKHAHIRWFWDYFSSKKHLLDELWSPVISEPEKQIQ